MKPIVVLVVIIFVLACGGRESNGFRNSKDTFSVTREVDSVVVQEDNKGKVYIANEGVLDSLLNFPPIGEDIGQVDLTSFDLKKTPRINSHDSSVVDTVYEFRSSSSQFVIYKAFDRYMLCNFDVSGNDFTFRNGVEVGIDRSELLNAFNLGSEKSDTISVGGLEPGTIVDFIFRGDKLSRVKYEGYID